MARGTKEIDLSYALSAKMSDFWMNCNLEQLPFVLLNMIGIESAFCRISKPHHWSTLNKGPFITFEPWSGLSTFLLKEGDHLEDKKNVCLLEANQVEELGLR